MTKPAFSSDRRRDSVKFFKLEDGREIKYRNDAELRLLKEPQSLQIALQEDRARDEKRRRWWRRLLG